MSSPTVPRYSPDLDRLRGIAILCVVIYHLNPSLLPSGFLGVDVFFVISGFLVARPIFLERTFGAPQIVSFLARRIRRIFPPLFFMVTSTAVFLELFITFLPGSYPLSILSALTFWANIFFNSQVDYFDTSSVTQPLLHTWSLAVEEQFYVLLAFLLVLIVGKRLLTQYVVLAVTGAVSFGLAILMRDSLDSFYFLQYRMWEFLCGVCLALKSSQSAPRTARSGRSSLLTLGSAFTIFLLSRFANAWELPRIAAVVIVVLAASLFVSSAIFQPNQKMTEFQPLVRVGKMSYSLYLWHYPIFVVANLTLPSIRALVASIVFTAIASWFSYSFVERTHVFGLFRGDARTIATGLALICLAAPATYLFASSQSPASHKPGDPSSVMNSLTQPILPPNMNLDANHGGNSNQGDRETSVAIVGDSFAMALSASGGDSTKRAAFLTTGDCWMNSIFDSDVEECRGIVTRLSEELQHLRPQVVLIHFRWTDRPNFDEVLSQFVQTVREATPLSEIALLGSVPTWDKVGGVPLPYTVRSNWESVTWSGNRGYLAQPRDRSELEIEADQLLTVISRRNGLRLELPRQTLCIDAGCLAVVAKDQGYLATAWDYGHLTLEGADAVWSEHIAHLIDEY